MSGLIVAHAGGIDEIAFVALPVLVFVVLQWLNRRRLHQQDAKQKNAGTDTNDSAG